MPHIGSGMGTIMSASELPMAVVMSSLVLGEHVGWVQWAGVLIILGGIAFGNLWRREPEAHSFSPIRAFK
ncbi:EamA family transporter [Paenibacillus sonchi]|uniref:EamA family transporter n=1 Tax=Paenibacillus sonchi TaxID=373687 RepID=UPI003CC8D878